MTKMRLGLILLSLVSAGSAMASQRALSTGYDQVWRASQASLDGYRFEMSDKKAGTIHTQWAERTSGGRTYGLKVTVKVEKRKPCLVTVTADVRDVVEGKSDVIQQEETRILDLIEKTLLTN